MTSKRRNAHQVYRQVLAAVFVCGSTYLLAHTVNAWMAEFLVVPLDSKPLLEAAVRSEPDHPASRERNQRFVQDILRSGLFPLPPSPQSASVAGSRTAPPPPPLDVASKVALIGVVIGGDGDGRAMLEEVPSKKQSLYRVTQHVPDVGELVAIEKDRVLFREGSQEEWLDLAIVKQLAEMKPFPRLPPSMAEMAQPLPAQANPPGRRIVDRAQLAALVANPQAYLTEARFQPHFSGNGQMDGFQVDGIRQVGLLEKVGLQNGDVLAGVNGVEVRDPGQMWEMFKQLRQERTVRFNVVRNSQPITLVVGIQG